MWHSPRPGAAARAFRRARPLRACWPEAAIVTGALAFTSLSASAQAGVSRGAPADASEPFVHASWTVEDGLPVNSINALLQSRDGYIWIATYDGLVRFDGVRFTVFNSANSPGLPSNRILTLFEARDGTLWLGTERLQLVRFQGRRLHSLRPRTRPPGCRPRAP